MPSSLDGQILLLTESKEKGVLHYRRFRNYNNQSRLWWAEQQTPLSSKEPESGGIIASPFSSIESLCPHRLPKLNGSLVCQRFRALFLSKSHKNSWGFMNTKARAGSIRQLRWIDTAGFLRISMLVCRDGRKWNIWQGILGEVIQMKCCIFCMP